MITKVTLIIFVSVVIAQSALNLGVLPERQCTFADAGPWADVPCR